MRTDLLQRLAAQQHQRASQQLVRRLRTLEDASHVRVRIAGRTLVSFASNDYLGLAGHPALRKALIEGAQRWGVGATASHLLGGHRRPHAQLQELVCDWLQRPRALLFSTGYMANLGVLGSLLGARDLCLQDKLNHRSLLDGAKLAGCALKRYAHADLDAAVRQLRAHPDCGALWVTDGVFSMDGDLAPLPELAALAQREQALLMVDDAHGIGVLGPEGAGSARAAGLGVPEVPIYMGTLGKALGCFGAFVVGSDTLIEGLLQFAGTHTYTTALPPALAAAAAAAIQVARHETWRREQLGLLVRHLRAGAQRRGLTLLPSATPIQCLVLGGSQAALAAAQALERAGYYVPAIRPPTVPTGQARLRISLCALHQEHEVEGLLDALAAHCHSTAQPGREGTHAH